MFSFRTIVLECTKCMSSGRLVIWSCTHFNTRDIFPFLIVFAFNSTFWNTGSTYSKSVRFREEIARALMLRPTSRPAYPWPITGMLHLRYQIQCSRPRSSVTLVFFVVMITLIVSELFNSITVRLNLQQPLGRPTAVPFRQLLLLNSFNYEEHIFLFWNPQYFICRVY